jgi:hypothetical protein
MDYTKAIDQISESPLEFNMWSAVSTISAVLKNNVWFDRGTFILYPNQYIVLVGPPGVGKGRAMHNAHDYAMEPSNKRPLANYITDKVTAPKLVDLITTGWTQLHFNNGSWMQGKDSTCILQASELRSLLHSSGDFMMELLCDTWDRKKYTYNTKNKGSYTITDMCVSLTGACTQAFIKDINKSGGSAVSGGFTARTIFVFATNKSKSLPKGGKLDPCFIGMLENDIKEIARLNGEFKFDTEAETIFEQKYLEIDASVLDTDTDVIKHFKSRQANHILKVAMTLSAARSDVLVIDKFHLNAAITLIDGVLKTLDDCFGGVGDSPLAEPIANIKKFIQSRGVVEWREIMTRFLRDVTIQELDMVLSTLCSCNFIKEISRNGTRSYQYIGKP